MKEIEEHDIVIVGDRHGTVVYIYNDDTYAVEFGVEEGNETVETITNEQITKVL